LELAADKVQEYCASESRCRHPDSVIANSEITGQTCFEMYNTSVHICGDQVNAEFAANNMDGVSVDCNDAEAGLFYIVVQHIAIIHGNPEKALSLGLCEVQVFGAESTDIDLQTNTVGGSNKVYPKYAPVGAQGFLHFLYDCFLRVWTKLKKRFGQNSLPQLPGECRGKNCRADGIGR